MKVNVLFTILIVFCLNIKAQDKAIIDTHKNDVLYKSSPVWIKMMNDPNTNYYEAVKSFNLFWEGKVVPAETEGEAMDLGKEENMKGEETEKDIPEESQQYVYEYKQFKHWELTMKNMIDLETGRIMSIDEVQQIMIKERNKK
jgi:hypothetical protein